MIAQPTATIIAAKENVPTHWGNAVEARL